MNKIARLAVIFSLAGVNLCALDIQSSVLLTNLYWTQNRQSDASGSTFQGDDWFWNWNGSVEEQLKSGVNVKAGWLTDSILRRQIYTELQFSDENLSFKLTPLLGLFETAQTILDPGMAFQIHYMQPGLGFLEAGFLTSFSPLTSNGDTHMSGISGTLGFLLQNGIVSLEAESKSFSENKSDLIVKDELDRYLLDTEIFVKNVPFRFAVDLGYQILSRFYNSGSTDNQTPVESALIGGRATWEIDPKTTLYINELNSLFSFGLQDTNYNVSSNLLLFQVEVGLKFKM